MLSFCVTDCGIPSQPPRPTEQLYQKKSTQDVCFADQVLIYRITWIPNQSGNLLHSPNNNWPEILWHFIFLINSVAAQEFLFQYPNPVGHNRAIKAPCAM